LGLRAKRTDVVAVDADNRFGTCGPAQRFAEEAIASLRPEIAERARNVELPTDLKRSAADALEQKPHLSWDTALAQLLSGVPDDAS